MALIGNQIRQYSDRVVLDSLTASATADYTLQLNSVDFVPSSASSLTVSLNGIIQKPESSYTVSGSTLSFDSALTASDSIDFVIAERGITLQTPSAGSVNTTQLASSAVTTAKLADDSITKAKLSGLGNYVVEKVDHYNYTTQVSTASTTNYIDIAGGNYVSFTLTSTSDKVYLSHNCACHINSSNAVGMSTYLMMGTSSSITSSDTKLNYNGQHTWYLNGVSDAYLNFTDHFVLDCSSLTVGTTYYIEQAGSVHNNYGVEFNRGGTSGSGSYRKHNVNLVHYKYIG